MKTGIQASATAVFGLALFSLLLFLPAGTLNYWQAWLFIAIFTVWTAAPNLYLAARRPEVLQRRLNVGPKAESRPAQKVASVGFFAVFSSLMVVSSLDHRFGWSAVPTTVVVLGQLLVAVGLGIAMAVVLQNSFAASNVKIQTDQTVISTGLYRFVRHPMYSGVMILMVGMPLALDSYWGLVGLVPAALVFVLRIRDEEQLLRAELDGYDEYIKKVHYRLVPGAW
jgi:protein-S-isoprenylcysteine O-methyltransferase Ste14